MPSSETASRKNAARRGSIIPVMLAGLLFLVLFVVFLLLALPVATLVVVGTGIVLMLFLFGAFHYFVWGWWLGPLVRDEYEAEQREAERRRMEG